MQNNEHIIEVLQIETATRLIGQPIYLFKTVNFHSNTNIQLINSYVQASVECTYRL